jgi:NAD(P)-dependent dehydrogenase (short-subunit alcohol dehydrogenase family)
VLDEEGKKVVADITQANGAAIFRHLDVTSEAEWKAAVDATIAEFGKLDILVNDAGLSGSAVEDLFDTAAWDRLMAVNARGVFLGMKFAIPLMKAAGGGSIVNISSISALRPRGLTTYTVSKAAVIGLTQAMAVDHGKDHIRVNCICPGPMYTPMVYARGNTRMGDAARAQRAKASVLKIEGTGWDIGHGVRFLMSNHARYITGQVLVIDGGVTLQGPERDSEG